MRRLTHEEYVARVRKTRGDRLILLSVYHNSKVPVEVKCTQCNHQWLCAPRTLYNPDVYKDGCPSCGPGWTQAANLCNKRFTNLTAIEPTGEKQFSFNVWMCKCVCGNNVKANSNSLLMGNTKSCGCLRSQPPGRSGFKIVWGNYVRDAKRRKLEFNLSEEQFIETITSRCFYCGSAPDKTTYSRRTAESPSEKVLRTGFTHLGIDRVDSNRGYLADNCVACCEHCNRAKSSLSKEEFYNWIQRVYDNLTASNRL